MFAFVKVALALFARNTTTGLTEQVHKTNDARNALHVTDQHAQPLTAAEAATLGLATAAKQDTGNASLGTIAGKDFATQATQALIKARADLQASEATLAALKARGDLLGTEVTLLNIIAQQAMMLTKLGDIFGAVDGLEVTAGNIEFNAANINLNVDGVELHLREIRDRLKLGQSTNAASSGVALSVEQQTILEALLTRAQFEARINTLGRKASAASTPVVLSDEQEAKVDLLAKEVTQAQRNNLAATLLHFLPTNVTDKMLRLEGHGATNQIDYHCRAVTGSAVDAPVWEVGRFRRVGPDNDSTATVTRTGTTATVTLASHTFEAGDPVYISGAVSSGINGYQKVLTVASGSFTFTSSVSGTIVSEAITVHSSGPEYRYRSLVNLTLLEVGW